MGENLHAGHRKRLKEKYRTGGIGILEAHEQLELLLFYAIPRCDTNATAHRLLKKFGSIPAILDAPMEEIEQVEGVGRGSGIFFRFLREIYDLYQAKDQNLHPIVKKPADAARVLMGLYSDWQTETLSILLLNGHKHVMYAGMLDENFAGWVNLDLRRVIHMAFHYGVEKIIFGHNHPSGDVRPSQMDIRNNSLLEHKLQQVGINMVDHIILHKTNFYSMAEHGEIYDFKKNTKEISWEYPF